MLQESYSCMNFSDTELASLVEQSLTKLRELNVPAIPMNYHVLFEHIACVNTALSNVMRVYLDSKHHLDQDTMRSLFDTYIAPTFRDHNVMSAADLDKVISQTMGIIDMGRNSATELAGEVSEVASSLGSAASGAANISGAVSRLAAAARDAIARAQVAEQELAANRDETRKIRERFEAASRAALTDGLTNIANRKHFDQKIRQLAAQAMETGDPLAIAMIDIDHFKKFNDTHGHQLGDSVIKLVARKLATECRPTDFPARYGGEEFALAMPKTREDAAFSVADRVRQSLAGKTLKKRGTGEPIGAVTISSGVSVYEFGEPIDRFIERADKALYQAKQAGRNCVKLAN